MDNKIGAFLFRKLMNVSIAEMLLHIYQCQNATSHDLTDFSGATYETVSTRLKQLTELQVLFTHNVAKNKNEYMLTSYGREVCKWLLQQPKRSVK